MQELDTQRREGLIFEGAYFQENMIHCFCKECKIGTLVDILISASTWMKLSLALS